MFFRLANHDFEILKLDGVFHRHIFIGRLIETFLRSLTFMRYDLCLVEVDGLRGIQFVHVT